MPRARIDRVDFTCEGPELSFALAHGYPDGIPASVKTANAHGDKNKLLTLYRQLVEPERPDGRSVQERHLQSPQQVEHDGWRRAPHASPNTLEAEINIAAQATILRARRGQVLTDQDAFDLLRRVQVRQGVPAIRQSEVT